MRSMSKYYILAEDTRGNWGLYVKHVISIILRRWGMYTDTERRFGRLSITNLDHYTQAGVKNAEKYAIANGMSYKNALSLIRRLERIQDEDLKYVKSKYVRKHTIKYSIISKDKALKITKSLPLKRYKNEGDPVLIKPNSIEDRRWINHYKKDRQNIYK